MKKYLSKWYLYLLAIALSVASFCLAVTFKTNPKNTERVNFFLGTYDAQTTQLKNKLMENKNLEDNTDYNEKVKELIDKGYSKRDAIKEISLIYNIRKNKLYEECKEL